MHTEEDYEQRLRAPTPFKGGVGCVEYHARRYIELKLDEQQATALWLEVKADLLAHKLRSTVREMKDISSGSLDTLPRGDVLDALARTLTAGEYGWPSNGDSAEHSKAFALAVRATVLARKYEFLPLNPISESTPA